MHKNKIEDLLDEVGSFVIQQESSILSLIPTELLKSEESEDNDVYEESYDEDVDDNSGSSDENQGEDRLSGEESNTDESSDEQGNYLHTVLLTRNATICFPTIL